MVRACLRVRVSGSMAPLYLLLQVQRPIDQPPAEGPAARIPAAGVPEGITGRVRCGVRGVRDRARAAREARNGAGKPTGSAHSG
jgi:hypothetical protein